MDDLTFEQDTEFQKLIVRDGDVDLTVAALELARDAMPDLDFSAVLHWIAERATEVAGALIAAKTEPDALRELGNCLSLRHGLKGRPESYELADSSFLNRIIETRRGIPISLSVLYMAVANKAGWSLEGVSAPRHFLTRYESSDGPLFIDAFGGGKVMTFGECVQFLETQTGLSREAIVPALGPASPRAIIIRMLNNLKAVYVRQNNWHAAAKAQKRLLALHPGSYDERRDYALISLKAENFGQAFNDLSACLKDCPADEREVLEEQIAEARKRVAEWN